MLENITMKSSIGAQATCLNSKLVGLVVATLPSLALAHPGDHGSDWLNAVMHVLSEPDHLAAAGLALIVAIAGVRITLRRSRRNSSQTDR
jgi:hydrogenase/urease accessory protein HupE